MAKLPLTMPAAVYKKPRQLDVEERPVPAPGPGEVLLEVSHCGICGTDLHLVLEGMGRPDSIGGHEYSGRIAALGAGVEGWQLGESVVGTGDRGCGRCSYCRAGRPSLCSSRQAYGGEFQGAAGAEVSPRQVCR